MTIRTIVDVYELYDFQEAEKLKELDNNGCVHFQYNLRKMFT